MIGLENTVPPTSFLHGAVGSDRAKQLIRIEKRQKKGQIHDVIGEKRLPKA
jgi:hypothetical protein